MATEYKLSYTAAEIDDKLGEIDALTEAKHSHNDLAVLNQINSTTVNGTSRLLYGQHQLAYVFDVPSGLSVTEINNKILNPTMNISDTPKRHLDAEGFSKMVEMFDELYAKKTDIFTKEQIVNEVINNLQIAEGGSY